jgi:hypothetical protein
MNAAPIVPPAAAGQRPAAASSANLFSLKTTSYENRPE